MDPRAIFFIAFVMIAVGAILASGGSTGWLRAIGVGVVVASAVTFVAAHLTIRIRGGRGLRLDEPWWRGWNDMDDRD